MSIKREIITVNKIKKNFTLGDKRGTTKDNVKKIANYFGVMESEKGRVLKR